MKTSLFAAAVSVLFSISGQAGMEDVQKKGEVTMNPIAEDTRIFKINPEIQAGGIRFKNRFGIELAGHLYWPAKFDPAGKYAAIAVCGPFGAVKEQASGLYAQELAARGFVALPSIHPIPERVPASPVMWHLPISIRRISPPRWTVFLFCLM